MKDEPVLSPVVQTLDNKKAENIVILNMKGVSLIADYFVICHGNSHKQVQAIALELKNELQQLGYDLKRLEGFEHARWILLDIGDVIVHVFHKEERQYYNLEKLWGDAPTIALEGVLK